MKNRQFTDKNFQQSSRLPPILGGIASSQYGYISGGFDFHPISHDHWQFFTLIPCTGLREVYYPFTLWEAQSKIVEHDDVTGYENKWTVLSQSLLAWGGKFFAVPIKNAKNDLPSFHLIRDSSPCYALDREALERDIPKSYAVSGELYRLGIAAEDRVNEENRPWHRQANPPKEWASKKIHCEKPVLDPEKYRFIALIYVEPEGKVYGFGKDFYVRLDELPESGDLASAIVNCRYVTQGKISGKDESGVERPITDPFRTVWECSLVLKESGLLGQ